MSCNSKPTGHYYAYEADYKSLCGTKINRGLVSGVGHVFMSGESVISNVESLRGDYDGNPILIILPTIRF